MIIPLVNAVAIFWAMGAEGDIFSLLDLGIDYYNNFRHSLINMMVFWLYCYEWDLSFLPLKTAKNISIVEN